MKPYFTSKDKKFVIYNADILEALPHIGKIDTFFTSPPYNMRDTEIGSFASGDAGRGGIWQNAELYNGYDSYEDNLPYPEYCEWQRKCLRGMFDVLKEDGAIFYNHKDRPQNLQLLDRREIIEELRPYFRQRIIWDRNQFINTSKTFLPPVHEYVFLFAKRDFRFIDKGQGIKSVIRIPQENYNNHPAPFPIKLPKTLLAKTSGDIVCDPFMGSGSTGIACKELKKKFIGIEISKKYCDMAIERYLGDVEK